MNQDTTPPYFTDISNQTAYNNESFSYDINASDETAFGYFSIDDTTNFSINSATGVITNATGLQIAYYQVNGLGTVKHTDLKSPIFLCFQPLFAKTSVFSPTFRAKNAQRGGVPTPSPLYSWHGEKLIYAWVYNSRYQEEKYQTPGFKTLDTGM